MNFGEKALNKPVSKPTFYGRDGERVDLDKARERTMKKLINPGGVEEKKVRAYDLAGNLIKEEDLELYDAVANQEDPTVTIADLSPEQISAVTRNIKSRVQAILDMQAQYERQGIEGSEVEKLLDIFKDQELKNSGVISDEMFKVDDILDDFDMRKSKVELKDAIDKMKRIGKLIN